MRDTESMPAVGRVIETCLHADSLDRAAEFYARVFKFRELARDQRFCAFSVSDEQVLLLFQKGGTGAAVTLPGGVIPGHGGAGQLHLAFTIAAADEEAWTRWLEENAVDVESRVSWPRGGISLYFRDPDGHLVELITPGCWAIY
jgi:catechol 2,3-dioxygenase-like lactoylglutathione lyase family enzyme